MKAAKMFINWLLTKKGGQYAMTHHDITDGDSYFDPVIKGITGHRHDPKNLKWVPSRTSTTPVTRTHQGMVP